MRLQKTILISDNNQERIDQFLARKLSSLSRKKTQQAINDGAILVNRKPVKPSYRLQDKDKIDLKLQLVPAAKLELQPQANIDFKAVFQHPDFLIIEKPAGLSVHPSFHERTNTLVNGLVAHYPQIGNVGEDFWRPGIVHRLDKDTSGLMIVALNQTAFSYFKRLFKKKLVTKKYLALVWGVPPRPQGTIKSFIGRSFANPLKQASNANPNKIKNPKFAETFYRLIKKGERQSLVEAIPKTGRMHQIRLHLHSIGCPIAGDKKYQIKTLRELNRPYSRHLLHAANLQFKYLDGQLYTFQSSLPADFQVK